jgi:uncharacterized protein YegL
VSTLPRRLPVYLLLDLSGSMAGEAIEAVRQGLTALVSDLRNDPQAADTAWLSVLTFASTAIERSPLQPLADFIEPAIEAGGSTALGAGLALLRRSIAREVRRSDWRPLVFLLTDGKPTDPWERAADELRAEAPARLVALAAGQADEGNLRRLTEAVLPLTDLRPDSLRAYFQWVAQAVRQAVRHPSPEEPPCSAPGPS